MILLAIKEPNTDFPRPIPVEWRCWEFVWAVNANPTGRARRCRERRTHTGARLADICEVTDASRAMLALPKCAEDAVPESGLVLWVSRTNTPICDPGYGECMHSPMLRCLYSTSSIDAFAATRSFGGDDTACKVRWCCTL